MQDLRQLPIMKQMKLTESVSDTTESEERIIAHPISTNLFETIINGARTTLYNRKISRKRTASVIERI